MADQTSGGQHIQDGTSQENRRQPALDPAQAPLESRTTAEWLAFARAFARQIYFYDVVDGQVKPVGDWRGFLPDTLDLDEIVSFMENPEHFPPGRVAHLNQPHFTLFLTFLKLLRHIREQFNELTGRHLDYYFKELLRLRPRPAQPDQVDVLIDINDTEDTLYLPAGTSFSGGEDDAGELRIFRTSVDQELNRAQIADRRAIFVDRQLMGIADVRPQLKGELPAEELFLRLLRIPLGTPSPGDPLPPFVDGREMTFDLLRELERHVTFIATDLFLESAEYRSLLSLKQQFDAADSAWQEIHILLSAAGRRRTGDSSFTLERDNPALAEQPRHFDAMLQAALGQPLTFEGDALTEVANIDQLYRQSGRPDVQAFIRDNLFFPDIEDFLQLMNLKTKQDAIWQQLMAILQLAGQRRAAAGQAAPLPDDFPPAPPFLPQAFDTNMAAALGADLFAPLPGIDSLAAHEVRLREIEDYFFMTAEQFARQLMGIGSRPDAPEEALRPVYALLQQSHARRVIRRLQTELDGLLAHPDRQLLPLLSLLASSAGRADPLDEVLSLLDDPAAETLLAELYRRQQQEPGFRPDDESWSRVGAALLQAAAAFVGQPEPYQETWFNLYATADPAADGREAGGSGWRPFGRPRRSIPEGSPPEAEIGWGCSSPLLAMRQGERTLTLTLDFDREGVDLAALGRTLPDRLYQGEGLAGCPLRLRVSTSGGWLEPVSLQTTLTAGAADRLTLTLTAQFSLRQGALAPFSSDHRWPELQLLLRQLWLPHPTRAGTGRYVTTYQQLRDLQLRRMGLAVAVAGLTPQSLVNDGGAIDGGSPFEPFGSQPTVGSRFALRDPELLTRRLSSLAFNFQWLGRPADLAGHYRHYRAEPLQAADFQVDILLKEHGQEERLLRGGGLFSQDNPLAMETIAVDDFPDRVRSFDFDRLLDFDPDSPPAAWPRTLIWELTPLDFQHGRYPSAAAERAYALARDIAAGRVSADAAAYRVESPYTPKMKSLTLDYTAEIALPAFSGTRGDGQDTLFHIHPFGREPVDLAEPAVDGYWLPQIRDEGALYLGLENVDPPQGLSLLFQLVEGSADPDEPAADLRWSYLSGNRWLPLDTGHLLEDSTRGLINSGIVRLQLPPALPSQLLPAGLYWLRISAARHTPAVADIIALHTQAVSLKREMGEGPGPLITLPPDTINETIDPVAGIAAVRQPYSSYGGRPEEASTLFYTRISERLRHRQRALTIWDYEHLLLAEFPDIYKVKCLPAAAARPGEVTIVVIPDIKDRLLSNPFEPKVPANRLADIRDFLADKIPPFTAVTVRNPHYEQLKIRVGVRFRPGFRPAALRERLNEALNRFLAPWAYDDGAELVIGGSIHASQLIHFIEEQPYVDYVNQIKLFRSDDGENFEFVPPQASGYAISVRRPDGILVAAGEHEIDVLDQDVVEERRLSGINYMKIELDFEIG